MAKGQFRRIIPVFLCLQFISTWIVQAKSQQGTVRFDYGDGPHGPAHWSELNSTWSTCKTGRQQSPMIITPKITKADRRMGNLDASYSSEPVPANISINVGYAVEVAVNEDAGVVKINGVKYRPAQFHFHLGSEHKIRNYSFPMEIHLVHMSEDDPNKRAVIAWLFVRGEESPFLAQFADKLPSPSSYPAVTTIDPITLPKLGKSYGRYQGSLTTPPCTEGVIWTVMLWNSDRQFPTISDRQIEQFKAAMPKDNVRPSMPSYGRRFRVHIGS